MKLFGQIALLFAAAVVAQEAEESTVEITTTVQPVQPVQPTQLSVRDILKKYLKIHKHSIKKINNRLRKLRPST